MEQGYIARTSGIKAKDKIGYAMGDFGSCLVFGLVQSVLLNIGYTDNVLNKANITDEVLDHMYNSSALIPAVLFLLVFVLLRFVYPLSKQKIDELQVEKEKVMGGAAE